MIARLYMAKELNVISDGGPIEPKDAVGPMLKRASWKTLKLIQRRIPTKEEIEKAQKLGKELFGKPGSDLADELCEELRKDLLKWQESLQGWFHLAQTGEYPGFTVIKRCLDVIGGVTTIKDTYEFITSFNKAKNDLLDTRDDVYDLTEFYKNQKPTWEKLRSAIKEFKSNRAVLLENTDAKPAMERLEAIFGDSEPYGMLKEIEGLITKVSAVNTDMITRKRKEAISSIVTEIEKVKAELEKAKADADLSNKILYPLQSVRKEIEAEASIPDISYKLEGFKDKLESAFRCH